ncbi:MAG: precorrin-4 C(11)-methyltransferase [Eggerthellaceae bacterium]|jgi:precorrin-4/cobalt-precorrin-4 C11-methyltransferase
MIHFVGAGPGAADLITVRGAALLSTADCIIYAGSLVNPALLDYAKDGCEIHNSASMTLEDVIATMRAMERAGKTTVRLHTGDPSLYGAIREQMDALDRAGIPYDVTPGVSSFSGAAAALQAEYTLPNVSQSVIITRMEGHTPVPEGEKMAKMAQHGCTMVLFLSSGLLEQAQNELLKGAYTPDTPAAIVYKATWPDQRVFHCTVGTLAQTARDNHVTKTALVTVGDFLGNAYDRSKLYDPGFSHMFRTATTGADARSEAGDSAAMGAEGRAIEGPSTTPTHAATREADAASVAAPARVATAGAESTHAQAPTSAVAPAHAGKLSIVGIGPGGGADLTQRARTAIEQADVIVGYTVYTDLLKEEFPDKEMLTTPMRREVERCRMALERAAAGERVALVCSGDPGVYGMAGLCFELAGEHPSVAIEVVPGISAALGGAAALGAPLMHDFAVISLSDLMTPWEKIERRLASAAQADFVICLYNPSSKKRADYLRRACDVVLRHKDAATVCGIVRNIGRDGEESRVLTLGELRDTHVDMFTTVYIGNSQTKRIGDCMVTPRGYLQRQG